MKKLILSFMMIGLIAILAACGDKEEKAQETVQPQDITMEEDEKVADDDVVISINDTEVSGDHYNTIYLQTKIRASQFGQDIEDKENIKEITLNEIIAQELIKQEAERLGIEVSEENVQEELDTLKSENEEQFEAYLETYNLTEDSLKEQIRFSQILSQFIEEEIEIAEVTEDDIKETYDQLKKDMENIMEFEQAEPIIEQQLTQQREADALQAKVEELMDDANIEKHI
ncbi:SurA N-terminal domain-containing protein [Ornithinibacillus massiliensis]|uniref:SurA N-terminal domain-containing protein n=1 Tax=Ornithinibacillus massiliensis TaxID=1944633 RepID=A0ABS5MGK7_9BACI|nr:SurA N-terminal domain-containing protein [Ornithinibacillus massiliensis]MBS3681471.1 SurA N-terminal domain-containing protein [Ornithinibacillus massiliensis]